MTDSLIPPGWMLEHHCVCGGWHEVTERLTFGGVPILPCPLAPPDRIFAFGVPDRPQYRVRER